MALSNSGASCQATVLCEESGYVLVAVKESSIVQIETENSFTNSHPSDYTNKCYLVTLMVIYGIATSSISRNFDAYSLMNVPTKFRSRTCASFVDQEQTASFMTRTCDEASS